MSWPPYTKQCMKKPLFFNPDCDVVNANVAALLERENIRLKQALEQIAKPALGGKLQQQIAQLALRGGSE